MALGGTRRGLLGVAAAMAMLPSVAAATDGSAPLPSWNDSSSRQAILDFVGKVTRQGSAAFLPPEDRIAVFDNDGTLWSEQPAYVQAAFVMDRIRALAPQHPEWREKQPFAAALSGDSRALAASGEAGIVALTMATHAGMTTDAFAKTVADWITTARHPTLHRPYTDLVFQPMLELLAYLRANDFRTWIVSGGGVAFMRPWAPRVYGVPTEQIIGSSIVTRFEILHGEPVLMQLAKVEFVDDGPGKAEGINRVIGRRPVFAAGNSDGDLQMLQWTTAAPGPRFGLIIHHTDGAREVAYDRKSTVGRLDKALDLAPKAGWIVVDMRTDWRRIYPFEN